jgi:hypothetical protein
VAAELDRIELERAHQFVDRAFDGVGRLAQAVAADRAGRHRVGVDGVSVDLLVRAAVEGDRFAAGVVERLAAVVTVGAGVGDDPQLHGGQGAIAARAELDGHPHRVAGRAADELLFARELELDRAAGLQRGQRAQILG